jgi:hypothetical protein
MYRGRYDVLSLVPGDVSVSASPFAARPAPLGFERETPASVHSLGAGAIKLALATMVAGATPVQAIQPGSGKPRLGDTWQCHSVGVL